MPKLVLIRHGQSQWNLENRFTGWTDIDLSRLGQVEAHLAGQLIKAEALSFDLAHTSVLTRAIRTLWIALDELDQLYLPYQVSWRLNERHYGALQGLNKAETAEQHGAEQVHAWRRSFATPPPPLMTSDPRHPRHDPRYQGVDPHDLPAAESLKDTLQRLMPFYEQTLKPQLLNGQDILISAHGNSLRALLKQLAGISDADIPALEIPTGNPLLLELGPKLEWTGGRYLDPDRAGPVPGGVG